jgi:hypothetical protein
MPILHILCYNGSRVTWTVVSSTTAKFKPLIYIFCLWLHLVLYREHVHSHDFVTLLFVACAPLLHNCIHTEGWKPCANRGPVCTLENYQWCGEPCFAGAAILRGKCPSVIPRRNKRNITDLISVLWRVGLMLALKRSLLNRVYILKKIFWGPWFQSFLCAVCM